MIAQHAAQRRAVEDARRGVYANPYWRTCMKDAYDEAFTAELRLLQRTS